MPGLPINSTKNYLNKEETTMSEFPQSRSEAILQATINGDEYTDYPQSRIEELLIELKEVIEEGGGGGAVSSVNGKTGNVTLDAEDVGALPDDTNIPSNTSDLNNDSGFITKAVNDLLNYYLKSEIYTKTEVDAKIAAIPKMHFEPVLVLPTEDIDTTAIYLVPKSISQSDNTKDEYINIDGTTAGWELIGDTEIDLSDYVTVTMLNTALANYVTSTGLATILADYATTSAMNTALAGKADSATTLAGYGITDAYTKSAVDTALAGKVDKVSGKGLSTNDYTTNDMNKLGNIKPNANRMAKSEYTLAYGSWVADLTHPGVYYYILTLNNPALDQDYPINIYFAEEHSYDDIYYQNAKFNTYKNIYNGDYYSPVGDYPMNLTLYYFDPVNMTAPSTTIKIYVEGVVATV